jgi:hypothetical protein
MIPMQARHRQGRDTGRYPGLGIASRRSQPGEDHVCIAANNVMYRC